MDRREWENFGEEIRKTVQNAVENQDYEKLNQLISNTVTQAMDTVSKGVKNAAASAEVKYNGYKTYTTDFEKASGKHPVKEKKQISMVKVPSRIASIVGMILGYTFGTISLIIAILFLVAGNIVKLEFAGFCISAAVFLVLAAVCMSIGVGGTKQFLRIGRLQSYGKVIGKREYCNVSELSAGIGKPDQLVVRDLEYMIKNRWFVQGHLDKQKKCLMVNDQIYQQYIQLEERKQLEQEEQKNSALNAKKEKEDPVLSPEVQKIISQGEAYIQKIRSCNDAIPGEEISEKISRMEMLVDKIFDRVEKEPKCIPDIRKLMEYYLPTTVKLLEAYAQMDAQPAGGENIQTAKREIEATLDTLNTAFEKLLDDLFQETAWDVSSDISVLNTMLAQEGLKEDGLKKK